MQANLFSHQVFDTEGDNYLGGKDLDAAIVDKIIIPYLKSHYKIDNILADKEKNYVLREAMKTYAEELLNSMPSPFWIDYIVPTVSDDAVTKINNALQDATDQLDLLNTEGRKVNNELPNLGIGGYLLYNIQDELDVLKRVSSPDNPRLMLTSDRLANMLYECSIDEYNIRKFSPDYSVRMLQNALELSNNLMDKEEIKDKIALFQKKAGKPFDRLLSLMRT